MSCPLTAALSEDRGEALAKDLLIARREAAERIDDKGLLERDGDKLDGGGLDEAGGLPVLHEDFREGASAAHLAGDGHEDHIAPLGSRAKILPLSVREAAESEPSFLAAVISKGTTRIFGGAHSNARTHARAFTTSAGSYTRKKLRIAFVSLQ
jgi:hypothetical protein